MDFESKDNVRDIPSVPVRTLIPPKSAAEVNEIFYNSKKPGQNLRLARETVAAAVYSGRVEVANIKGRYFPGTTILLEDLLDPSKQYTESELEAIEEPLIKPLQHIYTLRTVDEFKNSNQPKENSRAFAEYGADWLQQQLQPDLT